MELVLKAWKGYGDQLSRGSVRIWERPLVKVKSQDKPRDWMGNREKLRRGTMWQTQSLWASCSEDPVVLEKLPIRTAASMDWSQFEPKWTVLWVAEPEVWSFSSPLEPRRLWGSDIGHWVWTWVWLFFVHVVLHSWDKKVLAYILILQ